MTVQKSLPVMWADAHFDGMDVDYDEVRLRVTEFTGDKVSIGCAGWIALSVEYFRDDSMIKAGRLISDDPRIDAAREEVSARRGSSGSLARDQGRFLLLELDLDDGARWVCIAASFSVERGGTP